MAEVTGEEGWERKMGKETVGGKVVEEGGEEEEGREKEGKREEDCWERKVGREKQGSFEETRQGNAGKANFIPPVCSTCPVDLIQFADLKLLLSLFL